MQKTIIIPACEQHNGFHAITAAVLGIAFIAEPSEERISRYSATTVLGGWLCRAGKIPAAMLRLMPKFASGSSLGRRLRMESQRSNSQSSQDRMKALVLQGWAGIRYEAVEIVGETPKRFRVKILELRAKLAGRQRWANAGDIVLVPKYAVVDIERTAYERSRWHR